MFHVNALIGAALTRDVRAVPMLVSAMRGSNAYEMIAVKFAGFLWRWPSPRELKRLLIEEKMWFVRLRGESVP